MKKESKVKVEEGVVYDFEQSQEDYKEKIKRGSPEDYISRVAGSGNVLFKERLENKEEE